MKRTLGMIALSLCMVAMAARAADDPHVGRWKLDVAKSRYVTGTAPQSAELTITPYGKDGVNLTVSTVTAKGEKATIQYAAEYDGKPYPRTESGAGAVAGQTVTLKRIDAQTIERIVYLGGKPIGTERWSVSRDGKTRTVVQSGIDAKGKPIDNVLVYTKQ